MNNQKRSVRKLLCLGALTFICTLPAGTALAEEVEQNVAGTEMGPAYFVKREEQEVKHVSREEQRLQIMSLGPAYSAQLQQFDDETVVMQAQEVITVQESTITEIESIPIVPPSPVVPTPNSMNLQLETPEVLPKVTEETVTLEAPEAVEVLEAKTSATLIPLISKESEPLSKAEEEVEISAELIHLGEFKTTAYCPCRKCNGQWVGKGTALGTELVSGRTVAVDPKVIPLNSRLLINGQEYIAEDTGSAIKGNKIDVCFSTHQEALQYGVKYADIYLLA